jgi:hypothetical protein
LAKGEVTIAQGYRDVEIDYQYYYDNGATNLVVGQKLI